jgi:hypothetical protein
VACPRCECLLHVGCLAPDGGEIEWPCPFCRAPSADALAALGADLPTLERSAAHIRANSPVSLSAIGAVAAEEAQGAEWIRVVHGRDDVYETVVNAASAAVPSGARSPLMQELVTERGVLSNIADVLERLAEESRALETPVLDALIAELVTHGPAAP